jgi:cysteine synthase
VDGILGAIGDTPLIALRRYLLRPDVELWAKLEAANPGGSAKDRPAAQMLRDALDSGLIDLGRRSSSRVPATWASASRRRAATTGCG